MMMALISLIFWALVVGLVIKLAILLFARFLDFSLGWEIERIIWAIFALIVVFWMLAILLAGVPGPRPLWAAW